MILPNPLFRRFSPRRLGASMIGLVTVVLILYPSYRYPLQVNFSGTSPTYADTPTVLKAGKYVIAMAVAVFLLAVRRPKLLNGDFSIGMAMLIATSAVCLGKLASTGDAGYVQPLFWPWFAMLLVSLAPRVLLDSVARLVKRIFWLSVAVVPAVEARQILFL